MSERGKISILFSLLVIMNCFAANSVITRYLVLNDLISPFTLTVTRFLSGLFMLYITSFLFPGEFTRPGFDGSYLPGAFFLGIYAFSISYGYNFVPASAEVLFFYSFVVLAMSIY